VSGLLVLVDMVGDLGDVGGLSWRGGAQGGNNASKIPTKRRSYESSTYNGGVGFSAASTLRLVSFELLTTLGIAFNSSKTGGFRTGFV